jgi:ketosteroid isomerase-like protein
MRLFAPGSVVDDRRRLVGMRMSGESAFESARLLAGTEGLTLTGEAVATRGDRLVLLRQQFVHRSRAVIEDLTVHQVDESGELLELAVTFDPADEDAAWAELDARAIALEGDILRPLVEFVAVYNTHDLDRCGAWFHADCVFVNHAPAGWASFTTEEYLAYCQSLFDMTDDARVRPLEVAFAEPRGFLTRFRMCGRREGGYFEQDAWIVTGLRDGRIFRHEQFLIERRADAEACFARLEGAG